MNIDGLSLSPLVSELNNTVSGGRIDKIFQPDGNTLVIWIRQPGTNYRMVISVNPSHPSIFLSTKLNQENPAVPPAFCMLLRKHLVDGRIASIRQNGLDRVVTISIDVRDEYGSIVTKNLSIELMGKHSNIVFIHHSLIVDSIKRVTTAMSRHRQILPGRPYLNPPPQTGLNILTTTTSDFIVAIQSQLGPLSKAIINAGIGIGPITAKELVWRAGLHTDIRVDEMDDADFKELNLAIQYLVTQITNDQISPTVVTDQDKFKAIAAFPLEHLAHFISESFTSMSAAIEFATKFSTGSSMPAKDLLTKLITGEVARLYRKRSALEAEHAQALEADSLRCIADILMAHLFSIPAGCKQIVLPDLYSQDPTTYQRTIDLDPLITPLANAQSYYSRYNKLKRAQESLFDQIIHCQEEITYLESVLLSLEQATNSADTEDIRSELVSSGYLKEIRKRRIPASSSKPLTAMTTNGLAILIGKNNIQNDLVTFKQSHTYDLWFHTKDIPGSHVILCAASHAPSEQDLLEAAQIAAYHSKARQSANVPVDYTTRRFVKKPAGAKPGFVIYDHHSTIYVTPDEVIVKGLLKTDN